MNLREHAKTIPSMGGRQIGDILQKSVMRLPADSVVIEVGTWMGAGTAQVAMALLDLKRENKIYTYDRFVVSSRQPEKAAREGLVLKDGEDSYNVVKKLLEPFPNITIVKAELTDGFQYEFNQPIGLYIDDACKSVKKFLPAMKAFSPYFIPDETVLILMDFYLWKKSGKSAHKYQSDFIKKHKDCFSFLEKIETTYQPEEGREFGAMFLYKGGLKL